jgi:cell wall-associated NlpC family hydrolase
MKLLFLALASIAAIAILTAGTLNLLFPRNQVSSHLPAELAASQPVPVKTYPIHYEKIPPPKKPVVVIHRLKPKPKRTRHVIRVTPTVSATVVTPTPDPTPTPEPTTQAPKLAFGTAAKAVAYAIDHLDCPYAYGGTGPCSAGYDCSGLVYAAYAYAGTDIPRTSYDQWSQLSHVSTSALEPGDILVFYPGASHVGLYIGDGYMVDASNPSSGINKVTITSGYYAANLIGAVRP